MTFGRLKVAAAIASITLCVLAGSGCSMAPERPTIRVGIGMTATELAGGSSYDFGLAKDESRVVAAGGVPKHWFVDEAYDLIYVYKGRELRKDGVGGQNYFTAITTDPDRGDTVNSINITYQNRDMTLDEAVSEARRLQDWFSTAGFKVPSPDAPDASRFGSPFHIASVDPSGVPLPSQPKTYEDLRSAFLDDKAKVISAAPFDLAGDGVDVGLVITNAQRQRAAARGKETPLDPPSGDDYFLRLSIYAR